MPTETYPVEFVLPDGTTISVVGKEDEFLLISAYDADLPLPSTCLQGWCLTCAGRVLNGREWDQSASRRYFPQDRDAGFILLCTALPRSGLRIATHQRAAMRENRLAHRLPAPRGDW